MSAAAEEELCGALARGARLLDETAHLAGGLTAFLQQDDPEENAEAHCLITCGAACHRTTR